MTHSRSHRRHPTRLILSLIAAVICAGCHRQYYRQQADGEAHSLIAEKASHVARSPNVPIQVYVDRRSRMFNPFDLEFQPMPLDDPASYAYMQCVDGRRGYPMWEAAGITNTAENPDWWQFLPVDDDGVLVLNSENAVKIALLHSPDYQREVEELYLAALRVSAERFVFDTQFFDTARADISTSRGGPTSAELSNGFDMQRRFATGGELLVGLANRIVWNVGSGDRTTINLLDFTFIQPLLRNAGRDVVLENLTQSERELLARVRAFERFRRTFYLNVTVGARVEFTAQSATGAVTITPFSGGGAGGFLLLLQNQLQIRNSEENIARLQENALLLEDTLIEQLTTIPDDAGIIVSQRLQVAQARQQLVTAQQRLINQQADFQRSIDQFLRTLGLPPYICVRLDDPFLERFELIDRELLRRREQLSDLRTSVGAINVSILERGEFVLDADTGLPVSQMKWTPELEETLNRLRQELTPLANFTAELLSKDLPIIAKDIEDLATAMPERKRQNESLAQLFQTEEQSICGLLGITQIDKSIFDIESISNLSDNLRTVFETLASNLKGYQERINEVEKAFDDLNAEGPTTDPQELALRLRDEIILASQDLVAELGDDVLALQLIQARARTESVVLPEVDIAPEVALEIARKNRRDWANARAALVDSWRQIEVVADRLESELDLEINGNIGNQNTGQLNLGLRWDTPITRLLERNAYRRQLILYERDKRNFYQFEDGVWQGLRSEIRQLQANRFTFELGRELIRNSAAQIELNADQRALRDARGQNVGPTAARDQIQALSALLDAQNGLLNIFVNYEVVRRGLDLDLGTMELTPEGLWIDPGKISPETLLALPGTTVGGMIECGCNDCGLRYHPLPPEPYFSNLMLQVDHVDDGHVDMSTVIDAAETDTPIEAIEQLPLPSGVPAPIPAQPLP